MTDFSRRLPRAKDQVTGGLLTLSDGTVYETGALPNDGSGQIFSVAPSNITSLRFDVTSVSASTLNVGLSEIVVMGNLLGGSGNTSILYGAGSLPPAFAWSDDLAMAATLSASSSSPSQGAQAAADGRLGGYTDATPSAFNQEWATNGEGVGAWLNLQWASEVVVTGVALYDRPNLNVSRPPECLASWMDAYWKVSLTYGSLRSFCTAIGPSHVFHRDL